MHLQFEGIFYLYFDELGVKFGDKLECSFQPDAT